VSTQVNRRNFVKTIIGSAVALSIAPQAFAQYGPIPGKILLRYNENPYGPSPKGLKAGAEAAAVGAYYPETIESDLRTAIATRNSVAIENMVLSSGSNEALHAAMVAYGKQGKVLMPSLTYDGHVEPKQPDRQSTGWRSLARFLSSRRKESSGLGRRGL